MAMGGGGLVSLKVLFSLGIEKQQVSWRSSRPHGASPFQGLQIVKIFLSGPLTVVPSMAHV